MTEKNTGGPAFPPMHDPDTHQSGMTLRDYFAAHAPSVPNDFDIKCIEAVGQTGVDKFEVIRAKERDAEQLVRWRWHYADAMIRARGAA